MDLDEVFIVNALLMADEESEVLGREQRYVQSFIIQFNYNNNY
jgi:hypothetical protein